MPSDTRVINSLQALRGVAALAVFLFHLVPYFAVSGTHLFPAWLWRSGEFGVDLFFVLSGAVLALGYASRELSGQGVRRFYIRRALRIYSGYWPFLLTMFLVNTLFGFERALDDNLLGSVLLTEIDISKLVLGVSWSLSFELYFYLLFGLLFLVSKRFAAVLLGLYATGVVSLQYFSNDVPLAEHFIFSPFVLEFLLGCLVGTLYQRRALVLRSYTAWVLTALCFTVGAVLTHIDPARIPHFRIFTFGLGSALLIIACLHSPAGWTSRRGRALTRLGDASYTLYLCHIIFIDVAHRLGLFNQLSGYHFIVAELGNTFFVLLVCAFSIGFYRVAERPLYTWLTDNKRAYMA
jgi:peptidoglycan/LPS O-acetylase OafA/YrhL